MSYKFIGVLRIALLLWIAAFCLFEYVLHRLIGGFYDFETLLLHPETELLLFACIAVWCASFIALTFSLNDLLLLGLLLVVAFNYTTNCATASEPASAITFLTSVALGKGMRLFLNQSCRRHFILGFVLLLALVSWCHLDMSHNFYHGPRWMGLWNNPNIYGMLMGVGFILLISLLKEQRYSCWRFLFYLAACMIGLGLLFSYSRGAWCGVVLGIFYLGKMKGWKINRRYILIGLCVALSISCYFWNLYTDHWYLKRLDLSQASVQNRIAAWRGAVHMIRDHHVGAFGWNRAIEVYKGQYLPPPNGYVAINTNSYLMLGTELGLPALLCFGVYIWNSLKTKNIDSIQIAYRAGVMVLLAAFWFDGGLFELPTATVFWILLELGAINLNPP